MDYKPGDMVILWGKCLAEVLLKEGESYRVRWEHPSEQGYQHAWCEARELQPL